MKQDFKRYAWKCNHNVIRSVLSAAQLPKLFQSMSWRSPAIRWFIYEFTVHDYEVQEFRNQWQKPLWTFRVLWNVHVHFKKARRSDFVRKKIPVHNWEVKQYFSKPSRLPLKTLCFRLLQKRIYRLVQWFWPTTWGYFLWPFLVCSRTIIVYTVLPRLVRSPRLVRLPD